MTAASHKGRVCDLLVTERKPSSLVIQHDCFKGSPRRFSKRHIPRGLRHRQGRLVTQNFCKQQRNAACTDHGRRCLRASAESGETQQKQKTEDALPSWSGDYSPGDVLGKKYRIIEIIGRGSNGVTYKASTPEGKEVAIKALSLRRMTDWKRLELFQREARILESLNQPGIPRYIDYFEEDAQQDRGFFLVQELAQGKSLAELVSSGWRADEAEASRIASEILTILNYLSSRRPAVVHRDIKPDNIVVEGGKSGGRVFLVDFGGVQAAAAGESFALGSTVIGTYGYMAPEQFRGAAQPASDLYGLGGTLLYLLSGRQPNEFPQDRMVISFKNSMSVSPQLAAVLEGLLEPVLEDRLTAADALALLSGKQPQQLAREGDQPPGALSRVRERRGKMRIDIPPASIISKEKLGLAGFAATWNVGIGVWTASAIAAGSLAAAAFSIPFWAAGFSIARDVARSTLYKERIDINNQTWSIVRTRRFGSSQEVPVASGKTRDLKGAEVVYDDAVQNGSQGTEVQLLEGFKQHSFGRGLSVGEQRWLAAKITSFLQASPGQPVRQRPQRRLTWGEQISQDVNRRVAKELRDSGVDRFIQPGFGRPPFQTAVDDPYETYEANILWDQEERSEGSFGGSHSQDGLLADSAVKTQTRPTSVSEGGGSDSSSEEAGLPDSSNQSPAQAADNWMTDDLGRISDPEDEFFADDANSSS